MVEPDGATIEAIAAAADRGDGLARQVLAESGHWLGIGLATLANVLAPELIIVGGEGVAAGQWRLDPMRRAFAEHSFDRVAEQTELIIEPAGDETWARGAACVVLGELYKSPLLDRAAAPRKRSAVPVPASNA